MTRACGPACRTSLRHCGASDGCAAELAAFNGGAATITAKHCPTVPGLDHECCPLAATGLQARRAGSCRSSLPSRAPNASAPQPRPPRLPVQPLPAPLQGARRPAAASACRSRAALAWRHQEACAPGLQRQQQPSRPRQAATAWQLRQEMLWHWSRSRRPDRPSKRARAGWVRLAGAMPPCALVNSSISCPRAAGFLGCRCSATPTPTAGRRRCGAAAGQRRPGPHRYSTRGSLLAA